MPSSAAVAAQLRAAGCVFAAHEAKLLRRGATTPAELADLVARRVSGEPLELILGWAEFAGLRIGVAPGVFVPRRRTEYLSRMASRSCAARMSGRARLDPVVVVDLCCGSGAVARVVAQAHPAAQVHAADIHPAAVACARENLGEVARVHEGDLFAALPSDLLGRVDVLVVNAPYVPTAALATMPREARDHEPAVALDGGSDGLAVQRRVVAGAPDWLAPDGELLLETSPALAAGTLAIVAAHGFRARLARSARRDATVAIGAAS